MTTLARNRALRSIISNSSQVRQAKRHSLSAARSSDLRSRCYATQRQWSTPLAKTLNDAIATTGPISVASYMRQCLTSDLGGYYTPKDQLDRDPFGRRGDFITSPEISQVFGELVGLWIVAEWIAQGRVGSGVCLMELGPGRGTLMDDVLRTLRIFPDLVKAIDTVHLIEASSTLRQAQHMLLCGDAPMKTLETGHESLSKSLENVKIKWCEDIRLLPPEADKTPFMIAHEFFDALPVHVFRSVPPAAVSDETIQTRTGPVPAPRATQQSRTHQWREMLVAPAPSSVVSSRPAKTDEFQLVMSKASTPHSLYLPEQSSRYRALKNIDDAVIEVSPESQSYISDMAVRIGGGQISAAHSTRIPRSDEHRKSPASTPLMHKTRPSGAALIIDYGSASTVPSNSLRGIKQHQRVSPFSEPGRVDVSADVDFLGLAESALNSSPNVEIHGPVSQAVFLEAMGIKERASQLVKTALTGNRESENEKSGEVGLTEIAKRIESGWKRLVDRSPQGMGKLYQVMAILPHDAQKAKSGSVRRPVGFGGDVTAV